MGRAQGTPTTPALVAAVSDAGGLGCLGAAGLDPEHLSESIDALRTLTDRPFAVDVLLPMGAEQETSARAELRSMLADQHPKHLRFVKGLMDRYGLDDVSSEQQYTVGHDLARRQVEVALERRVPVIVVGLGDPGPIVTAARGRSRVIALAGSPRHARRHAERGVDAVIAQGYEAGGHTGTIATFPLVPAVVDAVSPLPVAAAGGIMDGRGLVAALALGAQAAWCGTLFLYAAETDVDALQRTQLSAAGDRDLVVSRCYTGKPSRIVRTPVVDDWAASGLEPLPMPWQHVLMDDFVQAARRAGRFDLVNSPAGQVAAYLEGVRPAAAIVAEMMDQARAILAQ